jgi:hypothetical protein
MTNQTEQVVAAMQNNGGYATFGQLNRMLDFSEWKTKTPHASVRRIVQEGSVFFRIQPGLWALKKYKDIVLEKFELKSNDKINIDKFTHGYYQGIIVEIGNLKRLETYVPPQDKNRLFLDKPLHEFSTITKIYDFSYPEILSRAKTVDVVWFNARKMPHSFFEIEHSTDIQNSLAKFYDLQDYYANFYIIAPDFRKKQYDSIISRTIFAPIKNRISFIDYNTIAKQHMKMDELSNIKGVI